MQTHMNLPPYVSTLSVDEQLCAGLRLESIIVERLAPAPRYPRQTVWWPRNLEARALREGILPRSRDEGFSDLDLLVRFFASYADGRVLIGDLGSSAPIFRYVARYEERLCRWIKSELVSNPTCLLSLEDDLVLIADEQLRYSVIGGSREAINSLEKEYGGAQALRDQFVDYVNRGELGFDEGDREWACSFLIPWSGGI